MARSRAWRLGAVYGVGAYGVHQALLRFEREGARLHPQIVLIGFISENVLRHINVYRPFLYPDGFPLTSPRFLLDGDGLQLVPNPLAAREEYRALLDDAPHELLKIGEHDSHFHSRYHEGELDWLPAVRLWKLLDHTIRQPLEVGPNLATRVYDTGLEPFQVTVRIFDRFYSEVSRRGMTPVIVILPTLTELYRWSANQPPVYAPLLDHFRARGYRYIDTSDAFETVWPRMGEDLYTKTSHFTPVAHQIAGDAVADGLERAGLIPPRDER